LKDRALPDPHQGVPTFKLCRDGQAVALKEGDDGGVVESEVGIHRALFFHGREDVLRIVLFQECLYRLVLRLKVPREGQRIAGIVVPGIDDGGVGEGKQRFDGMVKTLQVAGKTVSNGPVEEGISGYDHIVRAKTDRVFRMPRGVIHLDLFTIQFKGLAREQRPVVDEGCPGSVDQVPVAEGMVHVIVGIGDDCQLEPLRLDERAHLLRGAAVHGQRGPLRVQDISEIVRSISKLSDLHACPPCVTKIVHRQLATHS